MALIAKLDGRGLDTVSNLGAVHFDSKAISGIESDHLEITAHLVVSNHIARHWLALSLLRHVQPL
jgi:hypothetical protein